MQQPLRQKPRGRNRVLAFAQGFRHQRTALAALAILLSILLREVLLWQEAHGRRVSAGPVPVQVQPTREAVQGMCYSWPVHLSRPPGPHSFYIWDCTHRGILLCAMQKHILVLADPVAQENPLHFHDLHVMAEYMAAAGFRVTEGDSRPYHFRDRDDEALWQGLLVSVSHVEHMSSTRSEQQNQWSQRHFTAQSELWSLALSR